MDLALRDEILRIMEADADEIGAAPSVGGTDQRLEHYQDDE